MNKFLITLMIVGAAHPVLTQNVIDRHGAQIRSDTLEKNIYLCFTGHDFFEGFEHVLQVLKKNEVSASFFLTGDFIRNHVSLVKRIDEEGHFVGAHSDKHLLYCDWSQRDSLLYTPREIKADILRNLQELSDLGIHPACFMPPYEWYNYKVVSIAKELNQKTINFSPGTRSNADYTTPDMPNYLRSDEILESIYEYEAINGMNGFHLLIHPGTDPLRKDKLYLHLDDLIRLLKDKGYQFRKF